MAYPIIIFETSPFSVECLTLDTTDQCLIPFQKFYKVSGVLLLDRYVKRIMCCVNLIRYPIWFQLMLPKANRRIRSVRHHRFKNLHFFIKHSLIVQKTESLNSHSFQQCLMILIRKSYILFVLIFLTS